MPATLTISAGLALLIAGQAASPVTLPVPEPSAEVRDGNPWIITGTSVGIVGVLSVWMYTAWWADEKLVPFHFRETGFFGRDTYAGGADKLGHMYVTYLCARSTRRLYEELGLTREYAAWLSFGAVAVVSNGIEFADAFTEYGFEYGDVIFNTLGISFALAADLSPTFDSMFGIRLGYYPSRDFLAHDKTALKFINDYTGMLYYLDFKGKGIIETLGYEPGLARYLLGGLVWGTQNYSPVRVDDDKHRLFGVHLGLSLPQVLRDHYPSDEGVESFATFFDYYAMPFVSVALLNDLNTGEWMVNFGLSNRIELGL